jgi:hypothetical protein
MSLWTALIQLGDVCQARQHIPNTRLHSTVRVIMLAVPLAVAVLFLALRLPYQLDDDSTRTTAVGSIAEAIR